jgi:hypothetical protein
MKKKKNRGTLLRMVSEKAPQRRTRVVFYAGLPSSLLTPPLISLRSNHLASGGMRAAGMLIPFSL